MTARVSFVSRAKAIGGAVAWIVAFGLAGGAVSWTLSHVPAHPTPGWSLAWGALTTVVGFGFATWLVGHVLDRRAWESLGWRPRTGVGVGLAGGVASGAVMALAAVALAALAGHATVTADRGGGVGWGAVAVPLGSGLLLAALAEELVFRGYPLRRLADAIGAGPATAVGALGFGLVHLGNPNATTLSTVNVALAGVWLACAFFSPGAMPLAWGAHFGWNATLALGFDAPVSGYVFGIPAVDYHPGAHRWLDGGAFGPEGGIVATVVMLAGAAALLAWGRRAHPAPPLA
jgi:membrane protease YdiL (CAAX protease family)